MSSNYTPYHHYSEQDDPITQEKPNPVPEKRKGRKKQYIAVVVVLLLIIGASFAAIYYGAGGEFYTKDNKVAVIYVQGTMLSGSMPGGLGYVTSEEISDYIRDAVEDDSIQAIVLRINSPGGSPSAAEEIVTEIKKAQDEGVPIVVSMGDVAASAAYYIAAPTDMIYANPSTMTGSIGVIWMFQNMSRFYDEEGVEFHVAKSGEFKDMGGSWRGLSDDEKEYADTVIIEVYNSFVDEVATGRDLSRSDVKDLADGRIYTGSKAKSLGLVDDFGNMYDAIEKAGELAGIDGEPAVIYMNRPTLSRLLFGSNAESSQTVEQFAAYFEDNPFGKIIA